MPLQDITNPRVIAFLQESYEKASRLRMTWTEKYSEKTQCAVLQREPTNYRHSDIRYSLSAAGLEATTRDHVAAARHRMKVRVPDYKLAKVGSTKKEEPIMMPVDTDIKKLIKIGSEEYFKKRYKMNPEDKFYFPETTNWRYGWRLKDSLIKAKPSAFPRVSHATNSMFSTVGVQPDPYYYGNPDQLFKTNPC